MFDVPVVLFLFKRKETLPRIFERLEQVRPSKIYLIADEGRNREERALASEVRSLAESLITWDCEVVRDYADSNRGVHSQIGMGAMRVFEQEETAIFLEDDNLPETTFFEYCREMLTRYWDDERILWVCGTNYLGKYGDTSDYYITQHLLPCGWASWRRKYLRFYDWNLDLTERPNWKKTLRASYEDKRLYRQQLDSVEVEMFKKEHGERFHSWDYHMAFSLRMNNKYGIMPSFNQIKNIGVDEHSEHGGSSFNNVMTRRFCGMESYPLDLPMPEKTFDEAIDKKLETAIGRIILYPAKMRLPIEMKRPLKKILGVKPGQTFSQWRRSR